ncbi:DUF1822 family protein [Coleofasciculus sp. E2-BRE-01]|uniref:DUF1822 family protein n=1 Tax=Coleofasciculus sp. E2-BRE-01 TaxID=3069524 RepID=UPI0033028CA9
MINDFSDRTLEFEALPITTITLSDTQIQQAKHLIQPIQHESRQWQAYLNALALFGFKQWLQDWAFDLSVEDQDCSVFYPDYANILGAVCQVKVGHFTIDIIPIGCLASETVPVPRAILDLPEFTAHLYIIVEILEELKQIQVTGLIRYDQLQAQLATTQLTPEPDWTYNLPLDWLENPDRLLLYLRCLNPEAIQLPAIPPRSQETVSVAQFEPLIPQFKSDDWELSEVLTWEQVVAILTNSELRQWLLNPTPTVQTRLQRLQEPLINVGLWLNDEIDELTQKLSWVLLPALTPDAVPLRSPTQELNVLLQQLELTGKAIPPIARGGYTDLMLGNNALRLYAITWSLISPDNLPAWTLLLILGTTPGTRISQPIKLLLSDLNSILIERVLEPHSEETYIYAQVGGTVDEAFTVTLSNESGASLTLPPFVFRPN